MTNDDDGLPMMTIVSGTIPIDRRPPVCFELSGRIRQGQYGIDSFITVPRVTFTNHRIGTSGEKIQMLEALPDESGRIYFTTPVHPRDALLERIATVMTHPAMIREFFELLTDLGLSTDDASDARMVKAALLRIL